MKRSFRRAGFTMAEMMIAMAGTVIIVGALLMSSVGLQKAFRASEIYAARQADQRRLIDYLSRDLRRAVGIATATSLNGAGAAKLTAAPVDVEGPTALVLTLPGYYKTNVPGQADFDQALPVVLNSQHADYGTASGHAPGVPVIFRKTFLASEGGIRFVRHEAEAQEVIVRDAKDLCARITLVEEGTACVVHVWFNSPYGSTKTLIEARDQIMLRNVRID